jgi:hypothetical protein
MSRKTYHTTKDEWCGVPEVFDRADTLEVLILFPVTLSALIFHHTRNDTASMSTAVEPIELSLYSPLLSQLRPRRKLPR